MDYSIEYDKGGQIYGDSTSGHIKGIEFDISFIKGAYLPNERIALYDEIISTDTIGEMYFVIVATHVDKKHNVSLLTWNGEVQMELFGESDGFYGVTLSTIIVDESLVQKVLEVYKSARPANNVSR